MYTKKNSFVMLLVVGFLFLFIVSCGTMQSKSDSESPKPQAQQRVEQLPEGSQIKAMGIMTFMVGAPSKPVPFEHQFKIPYTTVWSAMKTVAKRFDKLGKRKVVNIDEETGRIQNGEIAGDKLIGLSSGAWRDEFYMEATSVDDNTTKVSVSRRVVSYVFDTSNGEHRWEGEWSNGKIELWLLTQIEDELNKGKTNKNNSKK